MPKAESSLPSARERRLSFATPIIESSMPSRNCNRRSRCLVRKGLSFSFGPGFGGAWKSVRLLPLAPLLLLEVLFLEIGFGTGLEMDFEAFTGGVTFGAGAFAFCAFTGFAFTTLAGLEAFAFFAGSFFCFGFTAGLLALGAFAFGFALFGLAISVRGRTNLP